MQDQTIIKEREHMRDQTIVVEGKAGKGGRVTSAAGGAGEAEESLVYRRGEEEENN